MYARVAVASNALDLGAVLPPIANALHSALVETLLAHGRLVFASNEEALDFVRAIRNTATIAITATATPICSVRGRFQRVDARSRFAASSVALG